MNVVPISPRMQATRVRIITAGERLFVDRGGSNVAMEDVAAEAGVGRATIYRHFEDREALVAAVREAAQARFVLRLEAAVAEHDTLLDQVAAMAAEYSRMAVETRFDHRRAVQHDRHLVDVFSGGMPEIARRSADFVEPLVRAAIERRELAEAGLDPRSYADWVSRFLASIFVVPASAVIDLRDPDQVADYVRTNLFAARSPGDPS